MTVLRRPDLRVVAAARPGGGRAAARLHVHWFRWAGDEWGDGGSVYRCRCGATTPGL